MTSLSTEPQPQTSAVGATRASRTALLVAAYRARASEGAAPLCDDKWASALSGDEGRALAAAFDEVKPVMALYIALRTAFLDAQVRMWTSPPHGFDQIVLLGAGLDSRAARLGREGLRFFEVDHPASQADKRRRVASIPGYPQDAATWVTCDFEAEDFLGRLVAAGFDPDRPSVILWEGVTMYLGEEAIRTTLRRVTSACEPHTVLLFDHVPAPSPSATPNQSHAFVANLGERFGWGTDDALPMLFEEGFGHVQSLTFDEICLTFTGTYDPERGFRARRMVVASKSPPPRP